MSCSIYHGYYLELGFSSSGKGDSLTVIRLCINMSQRQQKGGEDGRLYSKSMSELAGAKIIIDAGSLDNIASTEMANQLGLYMPLQHGS